MIRSIRLVLLCSLAAFAAMTFGDDTQDEELHPIEREQRECLAREYSTDGMVRCSLGHSKNGSRKSLIVSDACGTVCRQ